MSDEERMLKWGDYSASPGDVPAVSLMALAQRGWTHVFGNEVASALTAWRKTEEGKAASDADIAAYLAKKRDEKLDKIMSGTLGTRTPGQPKATGVEAIMRTIAVAWVKAALEKRGAKLPTGDKTVNVAGKDMTRDELIDATLRNRGEKIRVEAEAEMAKRSAFGEDSEDLFSDE